MPKRNTVSVLIPCYNAERFVHEAIESALNQSYPDVEVVVVDDGSTDGSIETLKSFGDRIRFEAGPNRGACEARNRAFELSSGKYVQFLDADDKLSPQKIERQIPLLLDHSADVVLCKFGLFGDNKGERPEKRLHPDPVGDPFIYFAKHGIGTPAGLFRRELVERSGGFLPGLSRGQEADFHLRVGALDPRMSMIDEILVWVRMHDGERITNRPADVNQIVITLIHQTDFIDQHDGWTDERREWIGSNLLQAARVCFASGDKSVAKRGLRRAIQVYPAATCDDRRFRKMLSACIGLTRAESVIHGIRKFVK